MNINVLVIGDIVGRPGRAIIKDKLPPLRTEKNVDFCVANGENAAGGSGILPEIADELFDAGIDVITTGDHIWKKKQIIPYIDSQPRLLRPANYPEKSAGKGFGSYTTRSGFKISVINLMGRTFMKPIDCPFNCAKKIIKEIGEVPHITIVDMHAEATSEKVAMGWYLDGRVSTVFGSHTHIQTADERVLPQGTAYITDLGMTGPYDSVIGRQTDKVIHSFVSLMPASFYVAAENVQLRGALIAIDTQTGLASSIERVALT